jgi:hypothetical protein
MKFCPLNIRSGVLMVLLGLVSAPSTQAALVAHLTDSRGEVSITKLSGSVLRPLEASSTGLDGGDLVATGQQSSANLRYRPDTVIELGQDTSVRVHEMPVGRRISAYAGRLLATVKPGRRVPLEIETPSGVVVVKGTVVAVTIFPGTGESRVTVFKGTVVFSNFFYQLRAFLSSTDDVSFVVREDSLEVESRGGSLTFEVKGKVVTIKQGETVALAPVDPGGDGPGPPPGPPRESPPPAGTRCDPDQGILLDPCTFGEHCCNGLCCGPVMFPDTPIGQIGKHALVCCQSAPGAPSLQACCTPEACRSGSCVQVISVSDP